MLKTLMIQAFKSFPKAELSFGKLNVFTGLNNTGKSTVLQAIRICGASGDTPYLQGLGRYQELRSKYSNPGVNITLSLCDGLKQIEFLELQENGYRRISSGDFPFTEYIGADRYGPRVALPVLDGKGSKFSVGANGEFSAHYAQIFENSIVALEMRYPEVVGTTLRHQLVRWMGEISPGVKIEFDVAPRYDSSSMSVDSFRATNSGFGLSYSLPIVLTLLTLTSTIGSDDSNDKLGSWFDNISTNGAVLILENPEAHLHPSGQTIIGELIAKAAACGLQIFLETHSDHLLDGIRLGIKKMKGNISTDEVRIMFFTKSDEDGTHVEEIKIQENGNISHWPVGFFDQMSINLRALSK